MINKKIIIFALLAINAKAMDRASSSSSIPMRPPIYYTTIDNAQFQALQNAVYNYPDVNKAFPNEILQIITYLATPQSTVSLDQIDQQYLDPNARQELGISELSESSAPNYSPEETIIHEVPEQSDMPDEIRESGPESRETFQRYLFPSTNTYAALEYHPETDIEQPLLDASDRRSEESNDDVLLRQIFGPLRQESSEISSLSRSVRIFEFDSSSEEGEIQPEENILDIDSSDEEPDANEEFSIGNLFSFDQEQTTVVSSIEAGSTTLKYVCDFNKFMQIFDEEMKKLRDKLPKNEPEIFECTDLRILQTSCNHFFHASCINRFLAEKEVCPNCKRPIQYDKLIVSQDVGDCDSCTICFENFIKPPTKKAKSPPGSSFRKAFYEKDKKND